MSSYSALLSSNSSENEQSDDVLLFDVADYLTFNEEMNEDDKLLLPPASQQSPRLQTGGDHVSRSGIGSYSSMNVVTNPLRARSSKIVFKTKSELEILDDGYKWRKYGKKKVKNSPNPRNYYRCSREGCNVKKKVEREREDSSYVMTTYEGVHNHQPPFPATTHPNTTHLVSVTSDNKEHPQRPFAVHLLGSIGTAVDDKGID